MQYVDPAYLISIPREAFLSDSAVYQKTIEHIVEGAAAQGQAVIVGRASQVILADWRDVLHVRVIAPFAQRVASVMQREAVEHHTAEARIHRKERERARYLEQLYHHHPDEAHWYDLVINTSRLDLDSAVDLIGCTVYGMAKGLASNLDELGPATGFSRSPAPPEDFPSLAR
jgi:cytidylate kinase